MVDVTVGLSKGPVCPKGLVVPLQPMISPESPEQIKMGLLQNLWVKIRVKSPKYQLG
jgi:hypothetical protein